MWAHPCSISCSECLRCRYWLFSYTLGVNPTDSSPHSSLIIGAALNSKLGILFIVIQLLFVLFASVCLYVKKNCMCFCTREHFFCLIILPVKHRHSHHALRFLAVCHSSFCLSLSYYSSLSLILLSMCFEVFAEFLCSGISKWKDFQVMLLTGFLNGWSDMFSSCPDLLKFVYFSICVPYQLSYHAIFWSVFFF